VGDNYEVSEDSDEQGQCALSIPFTRAGVSVTADAGNGAATRADMPLPADVQFENAAALLEAAAIDDFEARLPDGKRDKDTLASCFGRLKSRLPGILGRIQGAQTTLNAMTADVLGIRHLINRGVLLPRGENYQFVNAIFGGAIPKNHIPGVEKGVIEGMAHGTMARYPVVDVEVKIVDGKYHPVDSSELSFKLASRNAFRESMRQAGPTLLEPVMNLTV
jgi:hypothetical protein